MPRRTKKMTDDEFRIYRNRMRKINYDKTINKENSDKWWSLEEVEILKNWNKTDRELSSYLQRPVRGIQIKRYRLKKQT